MSWTNSGDIGTGRVVFLAPCLRCRSSCATRIGPFRADSKGVTIHGLPAGRARNP